jgi:tetratricopeptide (TPR) repeat protein
MRKHPILFLAANPSGTDHLALDREARVIQVELERSRWRDCFEFVTRWAAEPLDLLRELRRLQPTVVQFSGHGGHRAAGAAPGSVRCRDVVADLGPGGGECPGLFFHGADGAARVVSAAALRDTFGAAGASVKLVVLNACYSEAAAEALLAHVDAVVGMAGSIREDAARNFAVGFYGGLGERASIEAAFKGGCAAIELEGLPDGDRPRLRSRPRVDPSTVILAAMTPTGSSPSTGKRPGHASRQRRSVKTTTGAASGVPGTVGVQVRVGGGAMQRRSTVPSTAGEARFTGRTAELEAIAAQLRAERVVVLHGAPGLGKSRLAREYAHQHVEAYPGGMFFIPFDQPPPVELAKLLRDTDRPAYPGESVEDQCRRALCTVGGAGRALLIYDAIADERTLRDWLPYDGLDWHLIATSTSAGWAHSWSLVGVGRLCPDAERSLVASILGDELGKGGDRLVTRIAARADGVTVELCASAAAAHARLRRGRTVEHLAAELTTETTRSFESAWTLLSPEARLMLQTASTYVTPRFPVALVVGALQRIGWEASTVDKAVDEACDRMLATGDAKGLEIHQLVARFVRTRGPLGEAIGRSLFRGLLEAADAFFRHPGDLDVRALMQTHSLHVDDWAALVADAAEWHLVGSAVVELGQFAQALPWFERAVAAKEQGDAHGRVDAASLGASLHQVGDCYASRGQFAQALAWFERAVAAKEQGNVHGRVDAASLGTSLHQVGYCYSRQGLFAQALPWFERAVAAKEQGDVHGRVDAASQGTSLHQVGYCYSSQGKFAEALPWFERAVAAAERGDVHGRVDAASLGRSLHQVGYCYVRQGQFTQSLPWFEHAVAAKEQGDVHGRVNSESLGRSLHQVGDCYTSRGQFAQAVAWFERAVAAKEQGDVHGRVDSASLGRSLHQVGDCYARQGRFAEALPWFERAVAAAEQGDVHGRVDSVNLGTSLHQVGYCYARQRQFAQALPWFERAVAATEQGDVHGRVDAASLGTSLHRVGYCYASQGQFAQALPWFERAASVRKEKGGT